ncbi:uncharacterized protein LOC117820949 isoform X5 [Xyrichtys novacula]|uniref:Uncharacterized protein LOC117820949 isoform X5 n=1 Tax=Xyrichtys novacula TaxID=13765 RepID=A0AAV1EQZ2_XYRNO|nr:uncharacterized protein LOC117820949 isoform X5 [Xyrichtys novacula]
MANVERVKPMDCDPSTSCECSEQPSTSYEDIRTAQVTLTFKWSGDSPPQKSKLEMALQTWATKKYNGNCKVVNIRGGTAVIEFEPAPDLSDLQELCGQTLEIKDKLKNSAQIMCAIVKPPNLKTEIPDNTSEPQDDKRKAQFTLSIKWSGDSPLQKTKLEMALQTWACKKNIGSCRVVNIRGGTAVIEFEPAPDLCDLQELCGQTLEIKDKIKNSVQIMCAIVKPPNLETEIPDYTSEPQDGELHLRKQSCDVDIYRAPLPKPQSARDPPNTLLQKIDYSGSDFSLKSKDPKKLMDELKINKKKESKLLQTVSFDRMTVHGPSQSRDAIEKLLNTVTNTDPSQEESAAANQDTPNIGMNIQDPLLNSGLIFAEKYWKLINTSFCKDLAKIKAKFGVDVKELSNSSGQVKIEVCWKESGRNASMESHALRALLHLYQKIATSPLNNT